MKSNIDIFLPCDFLLNSVKDCHTQLEAKSSQSYQQDSRRVLALGKFLLLLIFFLKKKKLLLLFNAMSMLFLLSNCRLCARADLCPVQFPDNNGEFSSLDFHFPLPSVSIKILGL